MADDDKSKSKERLIKAKKAAVDAEAASLASGSAKAGAGAPSPDQAPAASPAKPAADTGKPAPASTPDAKTPPPAAKPPQSAGPQSAGAQSAGAQSAASKSSPPQSPPPPSSPPPSSPPPRAAPQGSADADQDDEHSGRSLSSILLQWIVIFFIGAAAALWAGPRIAPALPGWAAPVAKFLTPGADQAAEEVAALRAETDASMAALEGRLAALEGEDAAAAAAGAVEAAETRLNERIGQLEADGGSAAAQAAIGEVSGRVATMETTLDGLRAEVDALVGLTDPDAAPSAQTLERVAAFGAAVEGLRTEIAAVKDRTANIDALATAESVDDLAARVDALEGGEAATADARGDAERIRRDANLEAALLGVEQTLPTGEPFARKLNEAVSLSGEPAPEALAAAADAGVPATRELVRSFPAAAQRGYAAALEAEAGAGFGDRLLAKIEGRIGGRPAVETEGPEPGAVLSRMEARLREGNLAAVEAEAAGLPAPSTQAMAGWLAQLRAATAARAAFDDWRAALTAN